MQSLIIYNRIVAWFTIHFSWMFVNTFKSFNSNWFEYAPIAHTFLHKFVTQLYTIVFFHEFVLVILWNSNGNWIKYVTMPMHFHHIYDKITTQFTIYVACIFSSFLQISNKKFSEFATHQTFFPMIVWYDWKWFWPCILSMFLVNSNEI